MRKNWGKIFICLFTISLFGFITTRGAVAEELGACECVEESSITVGACSECATACATSYEADGRPFTVKACENSSVPGAKECFCHLAITDHIRREECRIGCVGYTYNFTPEAEPVRVDERDPCSRQEDCVGTAGDCSASLCFCDTTTSSCRFKKDSGSVCSENFECNSNICTPVPGGEGKTCKFGGLTPPGEEEVPPQTEEEVFPTYNIKSPIGEVTGPELIGRIIKAILGLVGALALAMFVFGGFTWLTSAGSPDKIKKGKDILIWATIGLIVIFTSYTLVDFLLRSFGL
ncbi:pilin [Patescibacteria group bacterium]|nr:pilin [Patescibacteria group bacterium]